MKNVQDQNRKGYRNSREVGGKTSGVYYIRCRRRKELSEIAYAAHTGEQKAQAKLEALKDRALRRDLEMKALASAIAESKRRVAAAQDAEARAEERRVAEELQELAQMMREAGKKADTGLAMMIEGAN